MAAKIHPTAEVSPKAVIGEGTSVWHYVQIREGVVIGKECIVGKNVYIDFGVKIGDRCKIQNNCSIYHGTTIGNGVFVGPHVVFTNDLQPRAINPDGSLKGASDWTVSETTVEDGAAVGAKSVILPGKKIGKWCMVGAGSVVTKDVPPHGLVYGNPAQLKGFVCACGAKGEKPEHKSGKVILHCKKCGPFEVSEKDFEKIER